MAYTNVDNDFMGHAVEKSFDVASEQLLEDASTYLKGSDNVSMHLAIVCNISILKLSTFCGLHSHIDIVSLAIVHQVHFALQVCTTSFGQSQDWHIPRHIHSSL